MKKIKFLRHYKLESPYESWLNMSLQQYLDLGAGRVDPDVNSDINEFVAENFVAEEFAQTEVVYTSPALRTKNSAKAIVEFYNLDIPIIETPLLEEIRWSPVEQISEESFEIMKRERSLNVKNQRILDKFQIYERVKELDIFICNSEFNNILCLTHSHLIAYLNLFYNYRKASADEILLEDVRDAEIGGYLKGIQVSIPKLSIASTHS